MALSALRALWAIQDVVNRTDEDAWSSVSSVLPECFNHGVS